MLSGNHLMYNLVHCYLSRLYAFILRHLICLLRITTLLLRLYVPIIGIQSDSIILVMLSIIYGNVHTREL